MPGIPRLSLVEGAFEELAAELATYLDSLKGEGSTTSADITPLLADPETTEEAAQKSTDKDGVLKKLVSASSVLNSAPERELQAAYNLLIHLISQSDEPGKYLSPVCKNLSSPIQNSPHNGTGIALGILGTVFNTIPPNDEVRWNVLLTIIELVKNTKNYETLQPQLKNIDTWVSQWELDEEDSQKLYIAIADAAAAANESEDNYLYTLKALRTCQESDSSSTEAQQLSLRALKIAFHNEKHFDFQDLTALDSVQALRKSDPLWSELLDLFSSENYDDLQDFKESNPSFLADSNLDEETLDRKMRLLTLASLAAHATQTRTLPYSAISKALNISSEDTEVWVIDSIRSGLVEGKLSQQKQEFLIHRSTYRTFGEHQWREIASRLETWRVSLLGVLDVIRKQKEEFVREKEAELSGGGGQGYGRYDRRQRGQGFMAVEVE